MKKCILGLILLCSATVTYGNGALIIGSAGSTAIASGQVTSTQATSQVDLGATVGTYDGTFSYGSSSGSANASSILTPGSSSATTGVLGVVDVNATNNSASAYSSTSQYAQASPYGFASTQGTSAAVANIAQDNVSGFAAASGANQGFSFGPTPVLGGNASSASLFVLR